MIEHIKKTKIGKDTYQLELLPAKAGFSLSLKLSKVLIPLLGTGFDAMEDEDGGFTRMSLILVEQMDQVDISELVDTLLEGLIVNGDVVDFDVHFRGNYGALTEVIGFSLKENFGSFFEVKGLTARLSEVMKKVLPQGEQAEESKD